MTNEEYAIEYAENMFPYDIGGDDTNNDKHELVREVAETTAQWKDEQFRAEKQQWIEKACEWLNENAEDYVTTTMLPTGNDGYKVGTTYLQLDKLVNNFLKAMEDEQ